MSVPRRHPLLRRDINLGCKHTGEKRKGRRNCILFSLVAVMSSVLLRGIDCNNWLNNSGRLASTMERGGGKEGNDWQHNLLSHLVPPPRKDSLSKPPRHPTPSSQLDRIETPTNSSESFPRSCPKSPTPKLVAGKKCFYKFTGKRAPLSNENFLSPLASEKNQRHSLFCASGQPSLPSSGAAASDYKWSTCNGGHFLSARLAPV